MLKNILNLRFYYSIISSLKYIFNFISPKRLSLSIRSWKVVK